jgi:hypothetical protein
MFILVIVAGLFGSPDPIRNIAPVMIWIIAWVGLAFLSLLLGDVWAVINPWDTVFAFAESSYRRIHVGTRFAKRYPEWLGVWPAFVLFISFTWMELVWSGKNVPAELAAALLIYSGLTWLGMFVFGRETWLGHGEVFIYYACLRDLCALCAVRADAGGRRRHPRAATSSRLARGSSLDDLDGRPGDCAAGDRHVRRFA